MARFPLSSLTVKKVWQDGMNPLDLLTVEEQKAAELYVSLAHNPVLNPGTLDKSKRPSFERLFREHFGFDLTVKAKRSLFKNAAWLTYVKALQEQTKQTVLQKLEAGAMHALDRYQKAGAIAESVADHKEMRLWSADYLDRVGATRKVGGSPPTGITIVLKGHAIEHAQVLKQLPPVEAEIVEEDG